MLRYISVPALIGAAGGDPWAISKSLQAGSPLQISNLAEAFHNAGRCTAEASHSFDDARRRFDAAWNHQNGDHPINDSAEVQRVTQSLGAQSLQLPKIGADLESIAVALAEAQKAAAEQVATLEGQLQQLDNLIGQAVEMEKDRSLTAADRDALNAFINTCEDDAIRDTKAALGQVQSIRNGYSDGLGKSLGTLRTEGYDPAALHHADADTSPAPTTLQTSELAAIQQATNQAVVDQMAKIRAAQEALNKAMADLYTHGAGSPEGEAASASLPKLKGDLAHAIDDLGKIPDYSGIDPASINTTPDGHFIFTYNVNGQPVQAFGQLKDGTGEFFDQATGTSYTFSGGKLTGMRTPDPGRVEATAEPLFTAVTLAVGAPELKAGGEAAWQGMKTLFSREALQGLTADNVLPRALSAAEVRAAIAEAHLPPHGRPIPDISGEPVPGTHPGLPPAVEHTPPAAPADIPVDHGPHVPVTADSPPPVHRDPPPPLPPEHPLFHGYHPVDPGPEFTRPDGGLVYPDDMLPTKPYAVPGTVVPDANLPAGTVLGRFGHPGGAYLAPDGTPFSELSLPPHSALNPYYRYFVKDPNLLPSGYHIEQSQVAPWFHQPGGGIQYRVIGRDGTDASIDSLLESGYLGDVRDQ